MNVTAVEQIAKAVLYEGYMLYPYRPSAVKNQQRWNFGVLCPPAYCDAQNGAEACAMQTECLVESKSQAMVEIRLRFLQLVDRRIARFANPVGSDQKLDLSQAELVQKLVVDGRAYQPWQEAIEREVQLPAFDLGAALDTLNKSFSFPAATISERLTDHSGLTVGAIMRQKQSLTGSIEIKAEKLNAEVFKLTVRVRNTTPFSANEQSTRQQALPYSLASAHTVLGVENGRLISLLEPEERFADFAALCQNIGTYPVLAGEPGQNDTVLSSPIILYDYPKIAPESSSDFFDGTEIDEILSLRIMTLTDEEKREISECDDRVRALLERTETMPAEQFTKLHGALRNLHPLVEEAP